MTNKVEFEYESVREAARQNGINHSNITAVCNEAKVIVRILLEIQGDKLMPKKTGYGSNGKPKPKK
jgi:tRNA(Phe) wybutosine-synthesizing methylase Tyw3